MAGSIERLFGKGTKVDTVTVESHHVLRVARGDSLLGFAEVRNVIGKDQPITFLVAIDPESRLEDVDILVYREPRGGEVAYDSWRKQFRGKDIRSISGATISSNSVTAGVRQALAELAGWRREGKLR